MIKQFFFSITMSLFLCCSMLQAMDAESYSWWSDSTKSGAVEERQDLFSITWLCELAQNTKLLSNLAKSCDKRAADIMEQLLTYDLQQNCNELLAQAVVAGNHKMVSVLLDNGAKSNKRFSRKGREWLPVCYAALHGNTKMIRTLRRYGARTLPSDKRIKDKSKRRTEVARYDNPFMCAEKYACKYARDQQPDVLSKKYQKLYNEKLAEIKHQLHVRYKKRQTDVEREPCLPIVKLGDHEYLRKSDMQTMLHIAGMRDLKS